jgi:hypothetical protein
MKSCTSAQDKPIPDFSSPAPDFLSKAVPTKMESDHYERRTRLVGLATGKLPCLICYDARWLADDGSRDVNKNKKTKKNNPLVENKDKVQ